MREEPTGSLAQVLTSYELKKVLAYDLYLGLLGGAGALWLALEDPEALEEAIPLVVTLVGVVIGAILAGVTVVAAFMDQPFLRKLKAIGKEPTRYLRPFLFTAFLGIVSSLVSVPLLAAPLQDVTWLRATLAAIAGLFSVWTMASVIPALDMLVQFVGLKVDAAGIPDEAVDPFNVKTITRGRADNG